MATAASLAGVQRYGLGWRAEIHVAVPKDIPAMFDELTTNRQAVALASDIASTVVRDLRKAKVPVVATTELVDIINSLDMEGLGDELIAQLDKAYDWAEYRLNAATVLVGIINDIEECLVVDDIEALDDEDIEDLAEGAQDELMVQLKNLYDWAGYYRILIKS